MLYLDGWEACQVWVNPVFIMPKGTAKSEMNTLYLFKTLHLTKLHLAGSGLQLTPKPVSIQGHCPEHSSALQRQASQMPRLEVRQKTSTCYLTIQNGAVSAFVGR